MRTGFKHRGQDGNLHALSDQEAASIVRTVNQDCGTSFKTIAEVNRYLERHPKLAQKYELLIPAHVALRVFNKALGTDFKTMEEMVDYHNAHPGEKERLAQRMDELSERGELK